MRSFFLPNWSPPDDPARPWPSDDDDDDNDNDDYIDEESLRQHLVVGAARAFPLPSLPN